MNIMIYKMNRLKQKNRNKTGLIIKHYNKNIIY